MDRNQIKVLIRQMTLEEKAGQVTQLPSRYFAIQGSQLTGTETKLGISEEKKWLCGSILGKLDAVSMRNIQKENLERSRLQIPLMFMTDIVHGYRQYFRYRWLWQDHLTREWSGMCQNICERRKCRRISSDIFPDGRCRKRSEMGTRDGKLWGR